METIEFSKNLKHKPEDPHKNNPVIINFIPYTEMYGFSESDCESWHFDRYLLPRAEESRKQQGF